MGWGEGTLEGKAGATMACIEDFRDFVIGADPMQVEHIWQSMYVHSFYRAGPVIGSAISGIDQALWDIRGKVLGMPVYKLLGGKCREKIKAYANAWYTTERTPEQFAEAAKKVVAKGYKALKVDPFGTGAYELERADKICALQLIEAIRDAVGPDVDIFIEGHGRFSQATAKTTSFRAALSPASRPASGPADRLRSKTSLYGSSSWTCSGSANETTTSGNAGASRSATHRTRVVSPTSSQALVRPMRRLSPPASTSSVACMATIIGPLCEPSTSMSTCQHPIGWTSR